MKSVVIGVDGMMCKHCKSHVEQACLKVANVLTAEASLEAKNVTVTFEVAVDIEAIKNAIKQAGYDLI